MDAAFAGQSCQMLLTDGRTAELKTHSWSGEASDSDRTLFVDPCHGPTLDLGCGPGRLTSALTQAGVTALGTDISEVAVRRTRDRGARALRRDVFGELPGHRQWRHVLLADGNVGIGGDPVRLLRRVAHLLHPTGSALVELSPTGALRVHEAVRLRVADRVSEPFAWANIGAEAIAGVAEAAALRVTDLLRVEGRTVATLQPV